MARGRTFPLQYAHVPARIRLEIQHSTRRTPSCAHPSDGRSRLVSGCNDGASCLEAHPCPATRARTPTAPTHHGASSKTRQPPSSSGNAHAWGTSSSNCRTNGWKNLQRKPRKNKNRRRWPARNHASSAGGGQTPPRREARVEQPNWMPRRPNPYLSQRPCPTFWLRIS